MCSLTYILENQMFSPEGKSQEKGKSFRALSFDMSFDIKVSKFLRPVYWCICVVVLLHTRPHTDTWVLTPVRTSPHSYTYVSAMKVPYMCVLIICVKHINMCSQEISQNRNPLGASKTRVHGGKTFWLGIWSVTHSQQRITMHYYSINYW